jgi:hypothetical protein
MKRSLGVGTVLAVFLAVIVSAACVAPAFALTTYHEYLGAAGTAVIDLPNHQPKMQLVFYNYEPNSAHGPGNHIVLYLSTTMGFAPVAILTTSPSRASFVQDLWVGFPVASNTVVVDWWDLQVCRLGKLIIAWWTVPIKGTITGNVPGTSIPWSAALGVSSFELPPGNLILNGYGGATTSTTVVGPLPSGYTSTTTATTYNAHGTFWCPSWHYFGPVADTPTVSTHTEFTLTHP